MSDEVMQDNMQHTMQDNKNPWNADLTDPMLRLRLASERLSIVRYVFLVQVEDGIASADERASLEYADAVLIGRPYVHALATAGALGVAHLLKLLREELEVGMALCGCRTLDDIGPELLIAPG